tara:strand:- start:12634 stop:24201 length:11568 start_codon:yes stop_codon:yes gene_type:complete
MIRLKQKIGILSFFILFGLSNLWAQTFTIRTSNSSSAYNVPASIYDQSATVQGGFKVTGSSVAGLYVVSIAFHTSNTAGAGETWVLVDNLSGNFSTLLVNSSSEVNELISHATLVALDNWPGTSYSGSITVAIHAYGSSVNIGSDRIETFVFDLDVPEISNATISCAKAAPFNQHYPHYAKEDDIIRVSMTTDQAVTAVSGTIAGFAISAGGLNGTSPTAAVTVTTAYPTGTVPFVIKVTDENGNESDQLTAAIPNTSSVIVDTEAPNLSCLSCYFTIKTTPANDYYAKSGDNIIVNMQASEVLVQGDFDEDGDDDTGYLSLNLANATDVTITPTVSGSQSAASSVFSATLTVTDANATHNQNIPFTLSGIYDRAGNTASNISAPTDGKYVFYDSATPTVDNATITTTNSNTLYAADGQTVTLSIETNEQCQNPPTVTFQGGNGSGTIYNGVVSQGSGGVLFWDAVLDVTTGIDEGRLNFNVTVTDLADNQIASAHTALSDENTRVTIDYSVPTINTLVIASSSGNSYAKKDQTVTVTVTSNDNLREINGDGITGTIGGIAATATRQSAKVWALTATMGDAHPEEELQIAINMYDLAGNLKALTNADITSGTVTYDKTLPTLTDLSFVSDNDVTTLAKDDDWARITFTAEEDLIADPTVLIFSAAATKESQTNRTYIYKLQMDQASHDDGQVTLSIDFTDAAGNAGTTVTHADVATTVTYDESPPVLNNVYYYNSTTGADVQATWTAAQYAKADQAITMKIVSNEDLTSSPVVWIGKNSGSASFADANKATVSQGANAKNWVAVLTIPTVGGLEEGVMEHKITYTDLVGNAGAENTNLKHLSATPANITYDETVPSFNALTYQSNNTVTTLSTSGNTITLDITADNPISTPLVSIHGELSSGSRVSVSQNGSASIWQATMTLSDADQEIDPIPISVTLTDLAGNQATRATPTNASTVAFDKTAPTLTGVVISSNGAGGTYAKTSNVVTVQITSLEDIKTGDSNNPTVNIFGTAVSTTRGATDKLFTATHTLAGSETQGTIDATNADANLFSVSGFEDPTGNAGVTVLIPTSGSVTYDRTLPTVDGVAITSTSTGANYSPLFAKDGDNIVLTIYTSEEAATLTSTQLLGDNTGITIAAADAPTNRTWTFTKTIDATAHAGYDAIVSPITLNPSDPTFFDISVTDAAGNSSTASAYKVLMGTGDINGDALADNAGTVSIDFTVPKFADGGGNPISGTYVTIASNNSNNGIPAPTLAVPDNRVTLSFKATEPIQEPTVTIATQAAIRQTPAAASGIPTDTWVYYYDMTSNESDGTVAFSITYKDRAGNDAASAQTALVGDSDGAVSFDKTQPTLSNITLVSDNSITNAYGRENSIITLTYSASEQLNSALNVVTIATETVSPSITETWAASGNTKETWAATYTLSSTDYVGQSDIEIPFTIDFVDLNGYAGTQVTETSALAAMTFDRNIPTIVSYTATSSSGTNYAKQNDVITLTLVANEDLDEPVITIAGQTKAGGLVAINQGGNKKTWTATYTMRGADDDISIIASTLSYTDLAGNAGVSQAPTPNIAYDKTSPTVSPVSIASNNTNSTASNPAGTLAKPGDIITLSFTFSEPIASPVVTITAQTPTTLTNASGDEMNWEATYTTTPATPDGTVAFTIDFTDASGNTGTRVSAVTAGNDNVTFDGTTNALSSVSISSDNTYTNFAKVTDLITLLFSSDEDIDTRQLPTVSMAGALPSGGAGNSASVTRIGVSAGVYNYSATYTMGSGGVADVEGTVKFVIAFEDIAGNSGTSVVAITGGENVTFDKTNPAANTYTLNCTEVNTLTSRRVKTNEVVTLAMVFNDEIMKPSITIAGNSISATDVTEGVDRTIWSAVYSMTLADIEDGNRMNFTISMTDSAGNTGTAINATAGTDGSFVIFDKTAPSAGTLTIASNNTWDDYGLGHPINSDLYAISGNTVTVTAISNEPLWTSSTFIKTAVSGAGDTYTAANAVSSSNSDKTWASTYIMQPTDWEGVVTFKVALTDSAGNVSDTLKNSDISNASSITYDRSKPLSNNIVISLSSGSDTGIDDADKLTKLVRPKFDISNTGGILTTGDSVLVAVDDVIIYREVVGVGITSFSEIQLDSDMTHEVNTGHEVKVYIRDPAGNLSDPSPDITVKVDTEIPTPGSVLNLVDNDDTGWFNNDNTTNVPAPSFEITGLTTVLDSIDLYSRGLNPVTAPILVSSDRMASQYSHTITVQNQITSNGKYGLYYVMHDDAGNVSVKSDSLTVIFDFTAPAAPAQPDLLTLTDLGELVDDNKTDTNIVDIKIDYLESNTRGYLYRINMDAVPIDTTQVSATYAASADFIVGSDGTKTYKLEDEIANGDSARFVYYPVTIDSAGNSTEGPDLTMWYDFKDPTGIVTYSDADDTVWAGNSSTIATINFNEAISISPRPTITLTYPGGGGTVGPINLVNDDNGVNKKWRYTIDLDEPAYQAIDGYMNIFITADDIAGNPVSSANLVGEDNLLFDNTKSQFRNITPGANSYINVLSEFSWILTEKLQSGIVHFDNLTLPAESDIQVNLTGTELTNYGFQTNAAGLINGPPVLKDGSLYNITYQGIDIAGNTGLDTVFSVRYDTTLPSANLNFSRLFASEDTTVVCTVKFNEPMLATPRISLDYGGTVSTADDIDSVAMTATADDSIWVYTATMPGGEINQGYVKPTVYAKDLATNALYVSENYPGNDNDSLKIATADSLYLDNTVATATLEYTNITQDTILVYHPASPPDTLWNVGIGGDTINIKVTMNEPLLSSPAPTLTLKYNSGAGDTRTINGAVASKGDSVWTFNNIVLLDSIQNDGVLKIELNALDRSTNAVSQYAISSDELFKVDNKPPAAFDLSNIRLSSVNPSLVVDWQDLGSQWKDMDNDPIHHWYNKRVTHFFVNVPLPPYDIAGLTDTTMWGGLVGIEFKNLRGLMNGQEWVQIGPPDTLDPQVDFDSTLFYRDTTIVNNLILNELVLGDSLIVRVSQTDIHGNKTYNTLDSGDKHKFFFDRTQMNVGQLVGGNLVNQDTLVSTDTLKAMWTPFLDPGGTGASGFWKYTFTVARHRVTALGDTLHDTTMTGYLDINNDGVIHDTEIWQDWVEVETANDTAEFVFNSAAVDTLKHNEIYEFLIFAQDLAGNMSDTVSSGLKIKVNSKPILSAINPWTMYEDSVYTGFQNIITTDIDSFTFQGEIINWSVKTFQDNNLYTQHPIEINGNVLSWMPLQSDVGNYNIRVIAEDLNQLMDSTEFTLEVIAVNDAPELVFVDSMGFLINPDSVLVFSFDEDVQEKTTLNLTQYVTDVDNNDSTEITWQAVILDTNQLGKPYPMGQVIAGPGTSMKQKVSLMKEFMGFNPEFEFIHQSRNRMKSESQARTIASNRSLGAHPISISLDTIATGEIMAVFDSDSNYYGDEHRVIFIVQDPFVPGDPFSRLEARDTIIVSVKEENDFPVVQEIDDWTIAENDSLVLDFGNYTSDVDDSVLTFVIKALTNANFMTISPDSFLSSGLGDSVILKPQSLWSDKAEIQVVAMDEAASDTSKFLLDIIRVQRPAPAVSIVQNNVFSHYLDIIIVDTVQKTTNISFDVQSEPMVLDTIAPYTWTSNFNFGVEKSYSFEIRAEAVVGDTMWGNAFVLALAKSAGRWFGSSSDGSFTIAGGIGSVSSDQPLLIVDSTLFSKSFTDRASYIIGNENYEFNAPVRLSMASRDPDRALYHRDNGSWKELPSISTEGAIITYSDGAGYYRLGPKTIIVPEITNLYPNYPNPFNPLTNIRYDIGLLDGLSQNVSINVYNLLGQRIRRLVENVDQLGQFTIQWDGRNETGKDMPTGIYFVQLTTGTGIVKNSKMMLLK